MENRTVIVLGAGLAGLSCAWRLAKGGTKVLVLEKESVVGGCARSFHWKDTIHDLGPHRWHSRNDELVKHLEDLMEGDLEILERLSRIFLYKKYFNYPLVTSNVVRNLPPWVLFRAFVDYLAIRVQNAIRPIPDDNFRNWTMKRFGKTLYEVFFGTYTEKAWGMPATQISADWASQRITLLSLWDAVKKTVFRPKSARDAPRTLVSTFWYPRQGGIGEISEHYRQAVEAMGGRVHTGVDVEAIHREGDRATEVTYRAGGETHREPCDALISTIPCTSLVRLFQPAAPPEVVAANDSLRYKAIKFVFLEVARERITNDHWIYIPEKHLRVHRISEAKNFNPRCAPRGKTVVCCEITCFKDDEIWNLGREGATKIAVDDLASIDLLRPEEVLDSHVHNLEHAYPIYDLEYKPRIEAVLGFVDSFRNLESTGRQGRFKYNNMDHSMEMGLAAAEELLRGEGAAADHTKVASGEEYFG